MDRFERTLLSIVVGIVLLFVGFLVRNQKVYSYQIEASHKVHAAELKAIEKGCYDRRYAEWYRKADYFDMAYRFWKPLESFRPPFPPDC